MGSHREGHSALESSRECLERLEDRGPERSDRKVRPPEAFRQIRDPVDVIADNVASLPDDLDESRSPLRRTRPGHHAREIGQPREYHREVVLGLFREDASEIAPNCAYLGLAEMTNEVEAMNAQMYDNASPAPFATVKPLDERRLIAVTQVEALEATNLRQMGLHRLHDRVESHGVSDHAPKAALGDEGVDAGSVGDRDRERLLHQDRLTRSNGRLDDRDMKHGWNGHDDRIDTVMPDERLVVRE